MRRPNTRVLCAFVAVFVAACGADSRPMTRSAADTRRRYVGDREENALASDPDVDGYRAPVATAPRPAEPAAADSAGSSSVETEAPESGAGGADLEEYDLSVSPSRPSIDDDAMTTRSVDALAGVTGTTASVTERLLNIGALIAVEPLPWVPLDPAPLPAGPRRVLLASLELPPGASIFPPSSSCQDVLLYVATGVLEASGTGVGTLDVPANLYAGDAARFGPEGDARVENIGTETARAVLAIARREGAGVPLYTVPDEGERCPALGAPDPLVRPMRVASRATAAPLSVLEGHLEVRILLDADGTGAMHAGLALLDGDAETRVAPHVHDASAELLFIEDGDGVMHVGERTIPIQPGVVVYVPEGVMHSFEPSGARPLVALQVYAPSGPEQRFRGLGGR